MVLLVKMKNTIPNEIPNGGYLKSLVLQSCWSMENNQLKMRWLLTFIFSARGWRWTAFQLAVAIPRCNRRSAIGMWSFKDTPEIHLIMPLSAVTNCWTSSVNSPCLATTQKHFFAHFCRHSRYVFKQNWIRTTSWFISIGIKLTLKVIWQHLNMKEQIKEGAQWTYV